MRIARWSGALLILCLASGCAYFSPQRMVAGLDPTSPKYATPECAAARQKAMEYDDRFGERAAMGAGAGRVGPIGIGAAIAIDQAQHERREAVKAEVAKHCT